MIEPSQATRPRWCPRCLTRMRVTRNPYYGVGLAVHQHLSTCPRCGFVQFLRGERRAEAATVAVSPSPSSLSDRMRGLVARLIPGFRGW